MWGQTGTRGVYRYVHARTCRSTGRVRRGRTVADAVDAWVAVRSSDTGKPYNHIIQYPAVIQVDKLDPPIPQCIEVRKPRLFPLGSWVQRSPDTTGEGYSVQVWCAGRNWYMMRARRGGRRSGEGVCPVLRRIWLTHSLPPSLPHSLTARSLTP